jgi:hypothetical protein
MEKKKFLNFRVILFKKQFFNVNLFGLVWDFLTNFFCEFSVLEIEFFFIFFFFIFLFLNFLIFG